MKCLMLCVGLLFAAGCASQGPIKSIIRDQQFSEYKTTLEQLEKDYLKKKLSYAEYLQQKKRVEENYQQKIDARQALIENQNMPSAATEMVP